MLISVLVCIPPHFTTVARKRPWSSCQKCRWQVTANTHSILNPTKSEWVDRAVQAEYGNPSGKRAHTRFIREHSTTVISARWAPVDWSLAEKGGTGARKLISTYKGAGGKWFLKLSPVILACKKTATNTITTRPKHNYNWAHAYSRTMLTGRIRCPKWKSTLPQWQTSWNTTEPLMQYRPKNEEKAAPLKVFGVDFIYMNETRIVCPKRGLKKVTVFSESDLLVQVQLYYFLPPHLALHILSLNLPPERGHFSTSRKKKV